MNELERRVSGLLSEYGEGLDMSTSDIDRLERGLEQDRAREQATRARGRGRIWQGAIAACALAGVVVGVLALRSDPAPTPVPAAAPGSIPTGIEGIWSYDSWLWTFTSDGRLTMTNQPYDPVLMPTDSSGAAADTYRTTPEGFIVHGSDDCDDVWTASLSTDGRLRGAVTATTGSGCPTAASGNTSAPPDFWEFTRVSPVSPAGARLPLLWPTVKATPVSERGNLTGTWLFPATGTLLAVTASGDYAIRTFDTLNRPKTGKVSVTANGLLVFTPADSPTCTAVYEAVSRNATLDATPTGDSCGRLTGATATWTRIN